MDSEFQKLRDVEAQITTHAVDLAALIAVPAQQRDGAAIREHWRMIEGHRRTLTRLNTTLRKVDIAPRRTVSRDEHDRQRAAKRASGALSQRLGMWDAVADMVARHIDPPHAPLMAMPAPHPGDAMGDRIYAALHALANPHTQTDAGKDHGCFADIALPIRHFDALLRAAYRVLLITHGSQPVRFLDVGCGGGTKVYAARRYFAQADGLEYDPRYSDAARVSLNALGASDSTVHTGDALTFEGYAKYDVIYYYRPLRDDARLAMMEDRIRATARPGTLVLAPYDDALNPRVGFDCAQVAGAIFVTGRTQAEANALRVAAECTATDILKRSGDFDHDMTFWSPILDAASLDL